MILTPRPRAFSALEPGSSPTTISDNKSNTFTALTVSGSTANVRIFYCQGGTFGTGHTFTNMTNGIRIFSSGFEGIYHSKFNNVYNGIRIEASSSFSTSSNTFSNSVQDNSIGIACVNNKSISIF